MNTRVIGFIPPVIGVEGNFNTFRIGGFFAARLNVGEEVMLMDEKEKVVFGKAVVEAVDVGQLGELCLTHGHQNHTEVANDPIGAPERLFKTITKIYGPHIAKVNKKTTVISLRRI